MALAGLWSPARDTLAGRLLTAAWRTLVVLAALWLVLLLVAWLLQRQLVYLPDRSAPAAPAVPGLTEAEYTTADDLELTGWFLRPAGADPPYATVVVANGNGGNRADRLGLGRALAARGYAVLLTDYRGYGGNPGSPDESGLTADLRAAVAYARARPDVDPRRLVYFGESLGTAVAAALAAERPPAALVLRSPFPRLADVGRVHYPFLPVGLLLRDEHPTTDHLASYRGPTLVVAAADDDVVPVGLSRRVADTHGTAYEEIPGAGHNDSEVFSGTRFIGAVDAFLRNWLPRAR